MLKVKTYFINYICSSWIKEMKPGTRCWCLGNPRHQAFHFWLVKFPRFKFKYSGIVKRLIIHVRSKFIAQQDEKNRKLAIIWRKTNTCTPAYETKQQQHTKHHFPSCIHTHGADGIFTSTAFHGSMTWGILSPYPKNLSYWSTI